MVLIVGVLVIGAAVAAVVRGTDVRLALLAAAVALGCLAGDLRPVVSKFLETLSNEQYVLTIGTAMGFAHVLKHTGCDRHLVYLLVKPLRKVPGLLVPGVVLVGFVVNIPVISQTSTAVCLGAVTVPLMRAAGVSPLTTGASLLLGASVGGELLNPGAPELNSVSKGLKETGRDVSPQEVVRHAEPLLPVQLGVAVGVFWLLSIRAEAKYRATLPEAPSTTEPPDFRVNVLKAMVPAVPLVLLFLTGPPTPEEFRLTVPEHWLIEPKKAGDYASRLIGFAMLVGTVVAALTRPRDGSGSAKAFFEGVGYAVTNIVALIVAANCFGAGIKLIGLDAVLKNVILAWPDLLLPLAALLPLAFAAVSGSGMAATQSLFGFYVEPSLEHGADPADTGAVVSIGAAAGRTGSPVAAVTLMCGQLTGVSPFALAKRVAVPLLAATAAMIAFAWWRLN
jgi:DcuC family C4-dicarboxylate transporter